MPSPGTAESLYAPAIFQPSRAAHDGNPEIRQLERARAFYERYGFRVFPSAPRRLFLPLQTFQKLGL